MKPNVRLFAILLTFAALLALTACSGEDTKPAPGQTAGASGKQYPLIFAGGPPGGTFNFFANKMAALISSASDTISVTAQGSAGSLANLRCLDNGKVDMALVYGGDAFLGRKGRLPGDGVRYDNVRAVAYLYGAPAQLVVRRDADIHSVHELAGKRVAIGNRGSGAALAADRFFRHLGLWDSMDIVYEGYAEAASEFLAGNLDAFWVLVGYPNSSVIEAATGANVEILDLHDEATSSGFYALYPFYGRTDIPAGTYRGQTEPVITFQDIALWCVGSEVDDEVVYKSLCAIYCEESLKAMIESHKAARGMSVEGGVRGVSIPLHPGAARFWEERGVTVPPSLRP